MNCSVVSASQITDLSNGLASVKLKNIEFLLQKNAAVQHMNIYNVPGVWPYCECQTEIYIFRRSISWMPVMLYYMSLSYFITVTMSLASAHVCCT